MPPRGRNIIRSWVRGGNECIRSSIACHLIMYNSYEQAHSIKKCLLSSKSRQRPRGAESLKWLLHFTRKFNLAITSRFPGSGIMTPLSFSYIRTMDYEICSSVTVTGSLRFHTWFPFLRTSDNQYITVSHPQHLLCSIWNYTDIIITSC